MMRNSGRSRATLSLDSSGCFLKAGSVAVVMATAWWAGLKEKKGWSVLNDTFPYVSSCLAKSQRKTKPSNLGPRQQLTTAATLSEGSAEVLCGAEFGFSCPRLWERASASSAVCGS